MLTQPDTGQKGPLLAGSGLGADPNWSTALDKALTEALGPLQAQPPDLLLLFVNSGFAASYSDILRRASEQSGAYEIGGCSASGVIGQNHELEGVLAIAALALRLPDQGAGVGGLGGETPEEQHPLGVGTYLSVRKLSPADVPEEGDAQQWASLLGIQPSACTGIVLLVDPFTTNAEALVAGVATAYAGVPIVGGLASGSADARHTHLFHGTSVESDGALLIGFTGAVGLLPVVSQGCEPIGDAWTVTDSEGYVVRTIGNKPAFEVLRDTLLHLSEPERERAGRNLLVGLAMDEYRESFGRGDFLIRNLLGVDQASGAIGVGGNPRPGQTLQFQVRDARAADDELRHLLAEASSKLAGPPAAAILFACNGRGAGLFGAPDHDAGAASQLLGAPPLAGLFCNGEIGPVGKGTYLHGFTASLGLIVTR